MTPGAAIGSALKDAHHTPTCESKAAYSRMVQRVRRRYGQSLPLLPAQDITSACLQDCHSALLGQGLSASAALRVLRQLLIERLVCLDCEQQASLETITQAMSLLAEFALNMACEEVMRELDARYGRPQAMQGVRARFWVVGMGKLGARELNVSSDIDLIYVYDQDGQTQGLEHGRGVVSNQEYFAFAVKGIYHFMGEVTEDGFVFRLDLALRPNGNSGPPTVSLDALQEYLQVQGREWERFAWLKSRLVAPAQDLDNGSAQRLRSAVLPFVFRRYLDYSVFEALRVLHAQIRSHASRRAAGHPERANDVKLARGGIREIEFTVQLLQVVRGGQFPELRRRSTLDALQCLSAMGVMPADSAQALAQAYVFLRRVEHRIQYLDDQQTHILPTQDADLQWIAQTMAYPDCSSFLSQLDAHRERVAQEFDALLRPANVQECSGCSAATALPTHPDAELDRLLISMPEPMAQRVQALRQHPRVLALRDNARVQLLRLVERSAHWMANNADLGSLSEPQRLEAGLRWLDWMQSLLRRESYLALLYERPSVHLRVLRLLGAARWPARYLLQHPGVIDELADENMLVERFDAPRFEAELALRQKALRSTNEDDEEALLNLLRRAHHAELFRILVRDIEGRLSVEQVADDLSALADTMLRICAHWCWQRLKGRHREEPSFGIIAYGKLGGKELGYGSDLDIVFVYDDADEQAPEVYAVFVRKLIHWLTVKTMEGDLFEIDTALRPNGNSGLLVTRFTAYADYQEQRGSNTAWTWEHQAMTRARFVVGLAALKERFEAVRTAVLCAARDPLTLKTEIVAMRDKVRAAHPAKSTLVDLKHAHGGLLDAEFAVQYLVLSYAQQYPELRANVGNIALLQRAMLCGLLPAAIGGPAADAYRELRHLQHQARLDERPGLLAPEQVKCPLHAIEQLWRAVFKPEVTG